MALKIQHWFFERSKIALKRLPSIEIKLSDSLIYDPSPQKLCISFVDSKEEENCNYHV